LHLSEFPSQPVAVLCDFDMTAATTDVIDFIYDNFCGLNAVKFASSGAMD